VNAESEIVEPVKVKMMRVFILVLLIVGSGVGSLFAQQKQTTELGLFFGGSNYLGDLQQVRFDKDELHWAGGVFTRFNFSNAFSFKSHFYKGQISGDDRNFEGLEVRKRNLHFRSDIYELGIQLEVTFLQFGERDQRIAAPYIFAGTAVFLFNPQAQYEGEWVDLQPLGTEGQGLDIYPDREKYELVQFAIPLGIGFNLALGKKAKIGFEIGFRKTFTDYLDDVSLTYPDLELLAEKNPMAANLSFRTPEYTGEDSLNPEGKIRGSGETMDLYFFGGVTLSAVIGTKYKSDPVYQPGARF
jgi:hypothetical protein